MAGATIGRSRAISIAKGAIKAANPSLLKECGGELKLTERWTRHHGKKKRNDIETIVPALIKEVKRSFQKKIAITVKEHKIVKELIINFDQTPLVYQSPGSYTMSPKGSKKVPIHDLKSKGAITGTVLPFQLIYTGKTERSLPKDIKKIKAENDLAEDCKSPFIFDVFRGQKDRCFYGIFG